MEYIEKTDYLKESKEILKDALIDLGANIDSNTPFRQYINSIDDIYNDFPKATEEGSNITLENTRKGKMQIQPMGNTTQNNYTGKNLANIKAIPNVTTSSTYRLVVENDTIILSDVTNSVGYVNTQKKLSEICPNLQVGDIAYLFFETTSSEVSKDRIYLETYANEFWNKNTSKTITQEMLDSSVAFYGGYSGTAIISNFMITKLNDNIYEPYTGGQASPNPDYPQPIKNVTGNNAVKIGGKNLFNKYGDFNYPDNSSYVNATTLLEDGTIKTNANATANISRGIRLSLKPNTTYVVSGKLISSTGINDNLAYIQVRGYATWWTPLQSYQISSTGYFTFTFDSSNCTGWFLSLNTVGDVGTRYEAIFDEIQIEEGTTAIEYEPYIESIEKELNLKSENLAYTGWAEDFVARINDNNKAKIENFDNKNCLFYNANASTPATETNYFFKTNWKENTQYTFSLDIYSNQGFSNLRIQYTDGTYEGLGKIDAKQWVKKQYTSAYNKTIEYLNVLYSGGYSYIDLDTFMIKEGSTPSAEYEPYYNYNLMKDDYITEDCVIHHKRKKMILDGSEDWIDYVSQATGLYKAYSESKKINSLFKAENSKCSHFKTSSVIATMTSEFFSATKYAIYIGISTEIASNATELKKYILQQYNNGTPVIIEYELIAEETEIIPDTIQLYNQIKELYKTIIPNQTILVETESEEENAPLIVKASALKQ